MAFKLAEAFVEIGATLKPLRTSLATARQALGGLVAVGARVGARLGAALYNPIARSLHTAARAGKAALLGLGVGAAAGIAYAVKSASDLNETISKTETVFGKATKTVTDGADEMAKKFGIPKQEFLDAAAGIGLIGKAAGQTKADAAKLAVGMAKLATDAASFYNIGLEEALEKIRSGLVGESEPLRALGVLLSEDAVKAEALKLKLVRANQELTEGVKVMARASLITRGLADATGDLEKTQDGLANRLREVVGRVKNLATQLGQYLLPAAQSISKLFADIASDVGGAISRHAAFFERLGASLKQAADWMGVLYRNFKAFKKLAGIALRSFGKMLGDNLKSAFKYAFDMIGHLAMVLGFRIEEAIVNALSRAFPAWVAPMAARVVVPPNPPKFKGVGMADELAKLFQNLFVKDAFRQMIPGGVRQVLAVAGIWQRAARDAKQAMADAAKNPPRRFDWHGPDRRRAIIHGAQGGQMMMDRDAIKRNNLEQKARGNGPEADAAKKELATFARADAAKKRRRGRGGWQRDPFAAQPGAVAEFSGIAEFAKRIQLGALNGDDNADRTAKATERTAKATEDLLVEAKKDKRQAAVPVGPA
jgi:hypothetical protein